MNSEDVRTAVRYVKDLWPKWDPSLAQVAIWETFLATIPDLRSVRLAADRAYATKSRFREPQISDLSEVLAQQPGQHGAQVNRFSDTGVWVINRANPVCPIPVVYPADRLPDPIAVRAAAQRMLEDHQWVYGGDWVVVTDCKDQWDARAAVDPAFAAQRQEVLAAVLASAPQAKTKAGYYSSGVEK